MTEQEATERIRAALGDVQCQTTADDEDCDILAQAAWNEMKAIAREDAKTEQAIHEQTLADIGRAAFHTHFDA